MAAITVFALVLHCLCMSSSGSIILHDDNIKTFDLEWTDSLANQSHLLTKQCQTVIVSDGSVNINHTNNKHQPVVLSDSSHTLFLHDPCNLLNVIFTTDINHSQHFIDKLVLNVNRNFPRIHSISAFFYSPPQTSSLKLFVSIVRKTLRILVISCPTCSPKTMAVYNSVLTLKWSRFRVGYSSVEPYFALIKTSPNVAPVPQEITISPKNLSKLHDYFRGAEVELLKTLIWKYHITVTLARDDYGTHYSNGTWTGKLKKLADDKVDFLVGTLVGNMERGKIGNYSPLMYHTRFSLISRSPRKLPPYMAPIKPFPWVAWALLVLSIGIVGPVIWWVTRFHLDIHHSPKTHLTILKSMKQVSLTLLTEPWHGAPKGPARLLLTGWFLASMALQCIYASNLIASFSVPEYERPVDHFEDVKDLGKKVLVIRGSTPYLYVSRGPKVPQEILEFVNRVPHPQEFLDPRLVAPWDGYIFRSKILAAGLSLQDFYISPYSFLSAFAGWLYAKNLIQHEEISTAILRSIDSGLMEKWISRQVVQVPVRDSDSYRLLKIPQKNLQDMSLKIAPLTLQHVQVLFYFWGIGMILGMQSFLIEVVRGRRYETIIFLHKVDAYLGKHISASKLKLDNIFKRLGALFVVVKEKLRHRD